MPLLTKSCDTCGVRNSAETPVAKDGSGKWACEKHKSDTPVRAIPGGSVDAQELAALRARVEKLETFLTENNELAAAAKLNTLLDDRLKVLKVDERLKALEEKKGGKAGG